ncbi:C4-dicarboxylate ABC transporter substrate-binding protein [soil metagenome]
MRTALLVLAFVFSGFAAEPALAKRYAKPARAQPELITMMTESFDAPGMRYAADIAASVDGEQNLRIIPMAGRGPVDTINDILYLRGVDTGIVPGDVIAFMKDQNILGEANGKLLAIAKLDSAQVHVVARKDITSLTDLAGKRVDIGTPAQARFLTGTLLFKRLDIPFVAVNNAREDALRSLMDGSSDAIVIVDTQPSALIESLAKHGAYHLLPIGMTEALSDVYSPALLTAESYGDLLDEGNVETIAVSSLVAVFDWPKSTERYYAMKKLTAALYGNGTALRDSSRYGIWDDINLAGDIPGWERYVTSVEWLAKHKAARALPAEDARALREQLQSMTRVSEQRSSARN